MLGNGVARAGGVYRWPVTIVAMIVSDNRGMVVNNSVLRRVVCRKLCRLVLLANQQSAQHGLRPCWLIALRYIRSTIAKFPVVVQQ